MPLTPSETRTLLESLGHHPVKKLGQNFLIDGNIVRKSLALAEVREGDTVVEVGPGLGTLTEALLAAEARVYAVELDPRLHAHLRQRFASELDSGQLSLLQGDAVEHPRGGLDAATAEVRGFKVVANLPYAVTTPWADALLNGPLPQRLVLMVQKEAADRLLANSETKNFGASSIFLQAAYRNGGRHPVSARCFHPVPGVDSVLQRLDRVETPLRFPPAAHAAVRSIFTQRRKQIGSIVRGQPELEAWLAQVSTTHGIHATDRPEDIALAAWLVLARL